MGAVRATAVVLVALALAGCGGRGGEPQVRLGDGTQLSLDLPPEEQPEPESLYGAVSGVVVDDAIFPLPGAEVAVRDRPIAVRSDEEGRFVLHDMAPGLYTLEVRRDGHADGLGTVNVRSGEVAKAVLMAKRLPAVQPYRMTHAFEDVRAADEWLLARPAGDHEHLVAFDRRPATLVLESSWPGAESPFGDPLDYRVHGESTPEAVEEGRGPNPLLVRLEAEFFAKGEHAVRLRVMPGPATLPPEPRGTTFATVFYVDPAPDGWSLVGGST